MVTELISPSVVHEMVCVLPPRNSSPPLGEVRVKAELVIEKTASLTSSGSPSLLSEIRTRALGAAAAMRIQSAPLLSETSMATESMGPVEFQVMFCVLPPAQVSPPLGAVTLRVEPMMVNTPALASEGVPSAASDTRTRAFSVGSSGTVQS